MHIFIIFHLTFNIILSLYFLSNENLDAQELANLFETWSTVKYRDHMNSLLGISTKRHNFRQYRICE